MRITILKLRKLYVCRHTYPEQMYIYTQIFQIFQNLKKVDFKNFLNFSILYTYFYKWVED